MGNRLGGGILKPKAILANVYFVFAYQANLTQRDLHVVPAVYLYSSQLYNSQSGVLQPAVITASRHELIAQFIISLGSLHQKC